MKNRFTIALLLIVVCLLALPALPQRVAGAGQVPVVRKIEPPNWWVNYTPTSRCCLVVKTWAGLELKVRRKK